MKITTTQIAELNPCRERFDNFKTHYPNFNGSVVEFLSLDNITYSDKVWVCVRLMSRNQKFYWARACAYSILELFEAKYPNDGRVRGLCEYLNQITDVTTLTSEQIEKIRTLRAAAYAAAAAAAYTAAAAAYAAYADAAYAADAVYAAYADAAYAAYADATDASAYAADRTAQEEYNLIILAEIMELNI